MSSNNIYNILNTLKGLEPTPEQTAKATAQSIYESVAAQGSVMQGVNSVEARLNEKYMGFKQEVAEGRVDDVSKSVKSIYYPDKAQSPIKKSRFAYDARGETNFKKYPDQTSRPAGMNPDPASRAAMDEADMEEAADPVRAKLAKAIGKYFNKIYSYDDSGLDIMDSMCPTFNRLMPKYGNDLDKMGQKAPVDVLKRLAQELKACAEECDLSLEEGMGEGIAEEREKLQTKKGTIYKGGTYGTEYDPSDEEKKTKTKHVPKKGQKGRPKSDKPTDTKSAPKGDIFGRTKGDVPDGKPGKKIKGKGTSDKSRNAKADAEFDRDDMDEAAKWRNPEYKGKFYTQKKGDSDDYDSIDYGYGMPERPKKDPGQKRRMGGIGDEWEVTDKLSTGHMDIGNTTGGAHWAGTGGSTDMKDWEPSPYKDSNVTKRGPRKGFITKSGINTVKDRIKGALGQHHSPVLPESADYKKQNFIVESFNFAEMMKETDQTVQEMLTELQNDIQAFKTTGECTPKLDAFLRVHGHTSNKKKLSDAAPVPYEVPAVQRKAAGAPALTPADVQQQDAARSMHPGMTKLDAPKPAESMNQELDELARLAGITDEGNAFTGKLKDTPAGGEFELDGKTFKDTSKLDEETCMECGMYESQCSCNEGNLFTKHLKDTPKGGEFEIDGKEYKDTSTKLEDIAKLAGIAVEGRDYGDTDIAEPPEYDNTPDEEVMSVDVLTKGGDGEVAGGEKAMHNDKPTHKNADNPLAENEFNPVEAMGRRLMKQYEAIKVAK
jgi:hypothetical protein